MEPLTEWETFQRLGLAMLVGAMLGFEREQADKPAGIRTYMLVCEGAALFMLCAILLAQQVEDAGGVSDPGRIASTVVQGIGFLAGGVILTTGARVRGLTTAAGIWVTAALGLLVGAGFFVLAIGGAVATLVALIVLAALERRLPVNERAAEDDDPAEDDSRSIG